MNSFKKRKDINNLLLIRESNIGEPEPFSNPSSSQNLEIKRGSEDD